MNACQKLVQSDMVRAVGVSNYSVSQMMEAETVLHLASNRVPYSMINRGIEAETVSYCLGENIGILAYSPLQRGFLTGKIAATLKKEFPSLPVFISLSKEQAEPNQDEIQINNALLQYSYFIGVSTYPFIFFCLIFLAVKKITGI